MLVGQIIHEDASVSYKCATHSRQHPPQSQSPAAAFRPVPLSSLHPAPAVSAQLLPPPGWAVHPCVRSRVRVGVLEGPSVFGLFQTCVRVRVCVCVCVRVCVCLMT
jgi:hypothetical protein